MSTIDKGFKVRYLTACGHVALRVYHAVWDCYLALRASAHRARIEEVDAFENDAVDDAVLAKALLREAEARLAQVRVTRREEGL